MIFVVLVCVMWIPIVFTALMLGAIKIGAGK